MIMFLIIMLDLADCLFYGDDCAKIWVREIWKGCEDGCDGSKVCRE